MNNDFGVLSVTILHVHYLLTPETLYISSFSSNGEITLHSGSHGKNVKDTVAVWSCIGVDHSRNAIKKLDSRLDTSQYKELLSVHVVPYCKERKLVHDYFPFHTAKSVRDFITLNGVQVIENWPNKSGDLMPLETIWKQMVKKLSGVLVFNETDLWNEISKCWEELDRDGYFIETINIIPKRLLTLAKDGGSWLNGYKLCMCKFKGRKEIQTF
jgi:hypothetical protein